MVDLFRWNSSFDQPMSEAECARLTLDQRRTHAANLFGSGAADM